MPKKSKIRPLRILWDNIKKKYYILDKGVRKYYKNLKGAQKIRAQKLLLRNPVQRISINKPTYLDERIKFLGLKFINPPGPGPSLEETDEGLKALNRQKFESLKDSPLDVEDYIETKLLENKKLTEDEEKLYPVIASRAKKERELPENAPIELDIKEPVAEAVKPKGVKKRKSRFERLFGDEKVDLGPLPVKSDQKRVSTYDPKAYLKSEIGKVAYEYAPIDYWIGPNTLVNELYPLIDLIKFLKDITLKKFEEVFGDWGVGSDEKDKDERLNTMKLKVIAKATPAFVEGLKIRGLVPGLRSFRKPISQYGTGKRLPALYSDEIDKFFADDKEYPYFGGVISADEINLLPKKLPLGFIMNLDNADQEGSHWVAVNITNDSIEYFDPFGKDPTEDFKARIQKFLRDLNVPVMFKFKINKVQRQHGNSFKCGYHAMRFLDDRFAGVPFNKATGYENVKNGDNEKDILIDWKNGEKDVNDEFEYI